MNKPSVFIRHGKTGASPDPDKPGKSLPISKWKLTKEGEKQAQETANNAYLHQDDVVIIRSTEEKAQQTAQHLIEKLTELGKKFIVIDAPEIRELNRDGGGDNGVMPLDQYEHTARQALENPGMSFENWETITDAYNRWLAKVTEIERQYPDKPRFFFGHGYTMGWHIATLNGDFEEIYKQIHEIPTGSFAVVVDGEVKKGFRDPIEVLKGAGERMV